MQFSTELRSMQICRITRGCPAAVLAVEQVEHCSGNEKHRFFQGQSLESHHWFIDFIATLW
jgi:hypothetical protein